MVVVEKNREKHYSFWSDSEKDEEVIFKQFLDIVSKYDDFLLFHYGNYEIKFLKRMEKKYGIKYSDKIDVIFQKSVNVLLSIYSYIYFPTYSNGLKDIAHFLGHKWTDEQASGIQSLIWRRKWELTRRRIFKEQLIRYNLEDCLALKLVFEIIHQISSHKLQIFNEKGMVINEVSELKQDEKYWTLFGNFYSSISDLEYINKRAYFDYQRSKIYVRTDKELKRSERRKEKRNKINNKINKHVIIPSPEECPHCKCSKFTKNNIRNKTEIDLDFSQSGIKKWIVRYSTRSLFCKSCQMIIVSNEYLTKTQRLKGKYGYNLKIWITYQVVANELSYGHIQKALQDIFKLSINKGTIYRVKSSLIKRYEKTYYHILNNIIQGNIIHIDETQVNLTTKAGYVWVFTNMHEAFFLFKETREGGFLHEILRNFKGVIISDFYSAYDSLNCLQQKCLIHLIRDFNNDLLRNPFDNQLRDIVQMFSETLRDIVETIDKFGSKRRHLNKHKQRTIQFFNKIRNSKYDSEITQSYQKRLLINEEKLFTFLDFDGVPWNNNNAENAVKTFATYRKNVDGLFTEKRLQEYLKILSIFQTCKYKELSFLDFLLSREIDFNSFSG